MKKKKKSKKANERASVSECTDVEQLKESSTGCKDELTECKTLRMVGFGGMALGTNDILPKPRSRKLTTYYLRSKYCVMCLTWRYNKQVPYSLCKQKFYVHLFSRVS